MKTVAFFFLAISACSGSAPSLIVDPPPVTDGGRAGLEDGGPDQSVGQGDADVTQTRDASGNSALVACLASGACDGCCSYTGCLPAIMSSMSVVQCGQGGSLCALCAPGQTCAAGQCQ